VLIGWWQLADHRCARRLSIIAGIGLIIFEAAELAWFEPLEEPGHAQASPEILRRASAAGLRAHAEPTHRRLVGDA
jgi:hypothetical protein